MEGETIRGTLWYMHNNCALSSLECTEGDVRLIYGPSHNEGTIEICHDDLWGLISDSGWSDSDAEVVCRQLGYSIISMSICSHLIYTGQEPIILQKEHPI